jgi:hypothetical protein
MKKITALLIAFAFASGLILTAYSGAPNILLIGALAGAALHNIWYHTTPMGILGICTLVGNTNTCDEDGNTGGIEVAWFASKSDIASLTFDVQGRLTAIAMVATKVFVKWEFEPDTAFFNQPKTVLKNAPFYKHLLTFINPKISTDIINAVGSLDSCGICGLVAIVKDNNGKFWLLGVKYFASTSTYSITGIYPAASDGAVTGANSESDSNQITTAFEGKVGKLARECDIETSDIPVS